MNKNFIILFLLLINLNVFGEIKQINNVSCNLIADAIFKIEGGNKTKYPYGIKSIKTSNPRQVCINTIKNNYVRWQKDGKTNDFLTFLGNRYCPAQDDTVGNKNWLTNIHKMIILKE